MPHMSRTQTPPPPLDYTVEKSLDRWLKMQGIGKKERTLEYHQEIADIIRARWPQLEIPVGQVTDEQCVQFATAVA